MSESSSQSKSLQEILTPERMQDVGAWLLKYPADQKQSAVMAVLRIVQEQHTYLTPELMDAVAHYLDMPSIAVYEVATFYSMYELRHVARHIIHVCTNISCKLRKSSDLMTQLETKLGITCGETTENGRFTLRSVECLGACVHAPVIQINKDYHENVRYEN